MTLLLAALALLAAAVVLPLLLPRARGGAAAASAILLAGFCLLFAAVGALGLGLTGEFVAPWKVPGGEFRLLLDPLSAWFLLPVALLAPFAAVYGTAYWRADTDARRLPRAAWPFLALLILGMTLVVLSGNVLLFIVSWEVMSLAAYFLVVLDRDSDEARRAGLTYLVAGQFCASLIIMLFLASGSSVLADDPMSPFAAAAFLCALAGFGIKAGVVPVHVWLPEAHPAAPSHVSALMSGVMIKMGVYGLVRFLSVFPTPPLGWALVLLTVGILSSTWGALSASAQRDLKRLLAYCSVENVGIIFTGLGLGLAGKSLGNPSLAVLGFSAALLHVLNHAITKALLFLSAGSVVHATGRRDIESMGGLLKRMPLTGAGFLAGAVAACGLPPFNGFVAEFLLLLAAFLALSGSSSVMTVAACAVIGSLALTSGLAAASFVRGFGMVFLGEPRGSAAAEAREASSTLLIPIVSLGSLSLATGLLAPEFLDLLVPVVLDLASPDIPSTTRGLVGASQLLRYVSMAGGLLLVFLSLTVFLRWILLSGRSAGETGTWDCGYARPHVRMQYTASSFSQPWAFSSLFRPWLKPKRRLEPPRGFFPAAASMATEIGDAVKQRFFEPLFLRVPRLLTPLQRLQEGRVQLYILYITLTLVVLLVWKAA